MADWSPSSDPHQDSNPDSLGFGKSDGLFHSANWAMNSLKVCLKTQDMYHQTLAPLQVKWCVLSESYRAHRLSADIVLKNENFSRYCFLLPSESNVAGPRVVNEFTFSGMKVRLWRSSI